MPIFLQCFTLLGYGGMQELGLKHDQARFYTLKIYYKVGRFVVNPGRSWVDAFWGDLKSVFNGYCVFIDNRLMMF
jgi:hypothetical protein